MFWFAARSSERRTIGSAPERLIRPVCDRSVLDRDLTVLIGRIGNVKCLSLPGTFVPPPCARSEHGQSADSTLGRILSVFDDRFWPAD